MKRVAQDVAPAPCTVPGPWRLRGFNTSTSSPAIATELAYWPWASRGDAALAHRHVKNAVGRILIRIDRSGKGL